MKKESLIIIVVFMCLIFSSCSYLKMEIGDDVYSKTTVENFYEGKIPGYTVTIREMENEIISKESESSVKCKEMEVYLNSGFDKEYNLYIISKTSTSVLYFNEWLIDDVFYYTNFSNSDESISFMKNEKGGWDCDRSDLDNRRSDICNQEEMNLVFEKINLAMRTVYNKKHLTSTLNDKKKKGEEK